MRNNFIASVFLLGIGVFFLSPVEKVAAHEMYVLTPRQISDAGSLPPINTYLALTSPTNFRLSLAVALVVAAVLVGNMLLRETKFGVRVSAWFGKGETWGTLLVRLTLAASLAASAYTGSFLGPELSIGAFSASLLIRTILYIVSAFLALGLFTEVAAGVAFILFLVGGGVFGWYVITYFNYFGEILALLLFGSRFFSVDRLLFGKLKRFQQGRQYETLILRICYGVALSFAAINIKFLHPLLTQTVVTEYHLTTFHLLFPSDPLLIVFGAGIVELLIGVFIAIGFQTRLINMVVLFYLTLSLLFFQEAVWPHLMLYGISLKLLFSPDVWGADYFIHRSRAKLGR